MQLPLYSKNYLGIDLATVPGSTEARRKLADGKFWSSLYKMAGLNGEQSQEALRDWKRAYGQLLLDEVIAPWTERMGRRPRILSVGAGFGFSEEPWLEAGYDITLQEFSEEPLRLLKQQFPQATILTGDLREGVIEDRYDIILGLGLESSLENDEVEALLSTLSEALTKGGLLVIDLQSSLSYLQMAKELVKRLIRRYGDTDVFMAWFRTPAVISGLGQRAGLSLESAYSCFARRKGPRLDKRPRGLRTSPTLSNTHTALVFQLREKR